MNGGPRYGHGFSDWGSYREPQNNRHVGPPIGKLPGPQGARRLANIAYRSTPRGWGEHQGNAMKRPCAKCQARSVTVFEMVAHASNTISRNNHLHWQIMALTRIKKRPRRPRESNMILLLPRRHADGRWRLQELRSGGLLSPLPIIESSPRTFWRRRCTAHVAHHARRRIVGALPRARARARRGAPPGKRRLHTSTCARQPAARRPRGVDDREVRSATRTLLALARTRLQAESGMPRAGAPVRN